MNITTFKKASDKILRTYVVKKIHEVQKIASWERPQKLVAYIDDSIFAGGKRIRPYLIYLMYKLFGGQNDQDVIRFSGSTELIHSLALIHDDVIDKGEMRHNTQCFHTYATSLLKSPNKEHLGMSQAILAGDLLHAWAYDILYGEYNLPIQHLKNAQQYTQLMIQEVIAGQMLDVDAMTGEHLSLEQLKEKNHYKSGQYTFTRPMVTGALLAGVDKKTIKQLEKIGTLLGQAYQIRDDILDVTIDEGDDTSHYDNKTKFSDIQDGQQTYLTHYIYEKGSFTHRASITKAMGKRLSKTHITELRTVFIDSGAISYGISLLEEHLSTAEKYIKKLSVIDSSYIGYFLEIVAMLRKV